jgi:hypothetical protein
MDRSTVSNEEGHDMEKKHTALPECAAGKVLMHVALVVSHSLMLPSFPADAYTPPSLRYRT